MRTGHFLDTLPSLVALHERVASLRLSLVSRKLVRALKYGYNPSQLRLPKGQTGGGQWTEELVRIAQSGRAPSGSGPRRTGGGNRVTQPTPAEAAELAASRLMLDLALRRVRAVDPAWKPTPSLTETIRGEILSNAAQAREAEARFYDLQRNGIGPGRFAGESIPARSPSRSYTKREVEEINRIGRETGCHTCGSKDSGLASRNFFKDHQLPTRWRSPVGSQRLFPQCQNCNGRQGSAVRSKKEK
ncbi:hypothetical protein Sa4125_39640 [Aureimonas sp. SA4125]|uniref:hypothetical protein n=1 Tax=Aureimonas sp. SA4125 TaxID=2826993 RepID=UPI001CC54EF1|nr:hypothetical protein [Aureimonas sp. SA4125]BDA86422.1 hypothetical protein Sa4125_39640 [Aureimonas sp. SA4125]